MCIHQHHNQLSRHESHEEGQFRCLKKEKAPFSVLACVYAILRVRIENTTDAKGIFASFEYRGLYVCYDIQPSLTFTGCGATIGSR